MPNNSDQVSVFGHYLQAHGRSLDRLKWRMKDRFYCVDWRGKDVLEVGCGNGDTSIYMALTGARRVVGLEPGGRGSNEAALSQLGDIKRLVGASAFEHAPVLFEDYSAAAQSFDIVFGVDSIEHICEIRKRLTENPEARDRYRKYFARIYDTLRPGGVMMQASCTRYGLAAYLSWSTNYRVRHPLGLGKSIAWEIHQTPGTWQKLAAEVGFTRVFHRWRTLYPLRHVAWVNRLGVVPFVLLPEYTVYAFK